MKALTKTGSKATVEALYEQLESLNEMLHNKEKLICLLEDKIRYLETGKLSQRQNYMRAI